MGLLLDAAVQKVMSQELEAETAEVRAAEEVHRILDLLRGHTQIELRRDQEKKNREERGKQYTQKR